MCTPCFIGPENNLTYLLSVNNAFYYFPVEISMASSGQRAADEKLQMEPVVLLQRQDLMR
jgi:hypothetical protein